MAERSTRTSRFLINDFACRLRRLGACSHKEERARREKNDADCACASREGV
jgi:hypothetical protein